MAALASAAIYPAAAIMGPCALAVIVSEWRRAAPRFRAIRAQLERL